MIWLKSYLKITFIQSLISFNLIFIKLLIFLFSKNKDNLYNNNKDFWIFLFFIKKEKKLVFYKERNKDLASHKERNKDLASHKERNKDLASYKKRNKDLASYKERNKD